MPIPHATTHATSLCVLTRFQSSGAAAFGRCSR